MLEHQPKPGQSRVNLEWKYLFKLIRNERRKLGAFHTLRNILKKFKPPIYTLSDNAAFST